MQEQLELIIVPFGEVPDDEWDARIAEAEESYRRRLNEYPGGPVQASISARNIGRGADWFVLVVSFSSAIAGGFFAIPKAHKLVRESIEEWGRIFDELKNIFKRLAPPKALYPDAYLFLIALRDADESNDKSNLEFHGYKRLPEDNPDFRDLESLVFTFSKNGTLKQVAVSRQGHVLWRNDIELSDIET